MIDRMSTVELRDQIMHEIAHTMRRTPIGTEADQGVYLQGLAACLDVLLTDERECRAMRRRANDPYRQQLRPLKQQP